MDPISQQPPKQTGQGNSACELQLADSKSNPPSAIRNPPTAARLFALGAWWTRESCRCCGRMWWKIEGQRATLLGPRRAGDESLCRKCAVYEEPLGARRQERINEAVELQEMQYHGRRESDEPGDLEFDDEELEGTGG